MNISAWLCSPSKHVLACLACRLVILCEIAVAASMTHPWSVAAQTGGNTPVTRYTSARRDVPADRTGSAAPLASGSLAAIAASSATDVWAIGCCQGTRPLIIHWDGRRWRRVPAAPTARPVTLRAIVALNARDAWAVGDSAQAPLIEHWDGAAWRVAPSPALPASAGYFLQTVAAASTTDVWAAGFGYGGPVALVEHWDGARWQVVPTPFFGRTPGLMFDQGHFNGALSGVAAVSHQDAWLAGTAFQQGAALVEHWDGQRWQRVSLPTTSHQGITTLAAVTALSGHDVWAVGRTSTIFRPGGRYGPVFLHWDGRQWNLVPGSAQVDQQGGYLTSVAATSTRDVWAVGAQGAAPRPLIEQWNGTVWRMVSSPALPNPTGRLTASLSGVAALSTADAWAVGTIGSTSGGTTQPLIEHWDGTRWRLMPITDLGL